MKKTDSVYDAVIVGSGINSMVAGALLAQAGWRVCVLERSQELGGALRTGEITLPGFLHDIYSGWHILFYNSPIHRALAEELASSNLMYVESSIATASVNPSLKAAFITRSLEENVKELNRFGHADGEAWRQVCQEFDQQSDLTLSLLGTELWSRSGLSLGLHAIEKLHLHGSVDFAAHALCSSRDWLNETFKSDEAKALFAPWVLHTGLTPESATSGLMLKTMAVMLQNVGVPIPKGGGARLIFALAEVIERHGGDCFTGFDVDEVLTDDGRAVGVLSGRGEEVTARHAVICNATPTQLYGRLLRSASVPKATSTAASRFRYGRGDMQIHFALSKPLSWRGDERLNQTPVINLTTGLDGVSCAVNEATRGLIPAEPTICVGQPALLDTSRAPDGSAILWVQLLEAPTFLRGDAGGEIAIGNGEWTEEIREKVADRVQQRISAHTNAFEDSILKRVSISPRDLERENINLVHGDPYSGSCELSQNMVFRSVSGAQAHETPFKSLFQIGASTWPGPGLSGNSGYLVANRLIKQHRLSIRIEQLIA